MQPALHMSMDVVYIFAPNKTSGGRYHNVTTCHTHVALRMYTRVTAAVATHLCRVTAHRNAVRSSQTEVGEFQFSVLEMIKSRSIDWDRLWSSWDLLC